MCKDKQVDYHRVEVRDRKMHGDRGLVLGEQNEIDTIQRRLFKW